MQDSYLDNLITSQHSTQATEYITTTYPTITDTFFKTQLIDFKTYQLVCLDNQSDATDIFGIKFKQYGALFKDTLSDALVANKTSTGLSSLTVTLERG